MANTNNHHGDITGRGRALFIFCWCGICGVLPDLDHLVYAVQTGVPIWDTIGHKPGHYLYPALTLVLCCVVCALLIGWLGCVVYDAAQSAAGDT